MIAEFDDTVLRALHAAGPGWLTEVVKAISLFGSAAALIPIAAVTVILLCRAGRKSFAAWLAFAGFGGAALSNGLKHVIGRGRPDSALHLVEVSTPSFPSSHALNAAVIYLTLAAILSYSPALAQRRTPVWCAAIAFVLVIGLTRIYLGVHFPTDVLGGWLIGGAWAFLFRAVVRQQKLRW